MRIGKSQAQESVYTLQDSLLSKIAYPMQTNKWQANNLHEDKILAKA